MTLAWSVSHPLRLVKVVARGQSTFDDMQRLVQSIDAAKAGGYRKIIDIDRVTQAAPPRMMREFARILRRREAEGAAGPLAIVAATDAARRQALAFAAAARGPRLIEVFATEADARRWLDSFYSFEDGKTLTSSR